jgi:hypothetical protein
MAKKQSVSKAKIKEQVYILNVSLPGTEPLVWRKIMVPAHFTFEALHSVLQLVMGWQMKHLYDFEINRCRFSEPDEFDDTPSKSVATDLITAIGENKEFYYNYDFGDSWRHQITVEGLALEDESFNYPICIGGENACPPEDCGGFPGFDNLKRKLSDTKDTEHLEYLRWVGGFYEPNSFDANRINRDMLWMIDWAQDPNEDGLYLPFNYDEN